MRINASLAGLASPPTSVDADREGDELFCLGELWGFTEDWSENRPAELGKSPKF